MKLLLLSGYGIKISVSDSKLHIQDGHDMNRPEPSNYVFKPKFIDYDNIVLYGHSGNITLDAIKWLTKQNIQLSILNWNGKLLTTILPVESKQSITRIAQYKAYQNSEQRVEIAKKFIDAKIKNSVAVLRWLGERYPHIAKQNEKHKQSIQYNWSLISKAKSVSEIMGLEGRVANSYWKIISSTFDNKFEFIARKYGKTPSPRGAVDPINALFNYGYSILESHCRKAVNSNGLDQYIGFLHEMNPSKIPLVYDLQEPFRWIVDIAVITSLEKKIFSKKDFIRTENYNLRIRPNGVKKLMNELNKVFSSTVEYNKQRWEWNHIIVEKANELAMYLTNRKKNIDFSTPAPNLKREDSNTLRKQILAIPYKDAKKLGFSKGTLWYMKQNAKNDKPFKVYEKVKKKLESRDTK